MGELPQDGADVARTHRPKLQGWDDARFSLACTSKPGLRGIDADQQPRTRSALWSSMAERQEHKPGTHAPATGHYEELNVFGTRTGRVEHVREGDRAAHARSAKGRRKLPDRGNGPAGAAYARLRPGA